MFLCKNAKKVQKSAKIFKKIKIISSKIFTKKTLQVVVFIFVAVFFFEKIQCCNNDCNGFFVTSDTSAALANYLYLQQFKVKSGFHHSALCELFRLP